MKKVMLSIALAVASAAQAADVPECQVRVLHSVADNMGDHWPAGKLVPVDILRRGENGVSYCAHGGSCIPEMDGGRHAVRLANCRPGNPMANGDYTLDPDPRTMGAAGARRFLTARRVGDKLSALGFSSAAIGSWSGDYAADPSSPNGRLVARALAGSKPALAAMQAKMP